ncbi:MAG: hypothetical protein OEY49_04315, partial [Candidatus Heimdallarchaeota archaeon]|nr:hypothetical protein [Candidatus Heimdallarchaeota archaeon]
SSLSLKNYLYDLLNTGIYTIISLNYYLLRSVFNWIYSTSAEDTIITSRWLLHFMMNENTIIYLKIYQSIIPFLILLFFSKTVKDKTSIFLIKLSVPLILASFIWDIFLYFKVYPSFFIFIFTPHRFLISLFYIYMLSLFLIIQRILVLIDNMPSLSYIQIKKCRLRRSTIIKLIILLIIYLCLIPSVYFHKIYTGHYNIWKDNFEKYNSDVEMINWMKENLNEGDLILNDMHTGLWIPTIWPESNVTYRSVPSFFIYNQTIESEVYHILNPSLDNRSRIELFLKFNVSYIYLGSDFTDDLIRELLISLSFVSYFQINLVNLFIINLNLISTLE